MERVFVNLEKYGNTSAASIGLALAEADEAGLLKRDDIVVTVGFGGGLTWSGAALRWY
jgi:3-oxoacyl-[acyl-carrier-protein] synthase-3